MKKKNSLIQISKWLRELSIVVVGIAITLMANNWIESNKEKKDLQNHLEAVKLELQDNLEIMKDNAVFYDRTASLSKYLNSHKPEEIVTDSINKYGDIFGRFVIVTYKTSAFEMLKISGMMRLIKDKALLASILDSYTKMDAAKNASDVYMNRKTDELFKVYLDNFLTITSIDISDPQYRRFYSFFAIYMDLEKVFDDCAKQIETTLTMF